MQLQPMAAAIAAAKTPRRVRGIVKARAEAGSVSAELKAQIDGITAAVETMKQGQVKPETVAALDASVKDIKSSLAAMADQVAALKLNPAYGSAARTYKRHKALKAFRGERAEENAYRSGMWAAAAIFGNAKAVAWCNDNGLRLARDPSQDPVAIAGSGVFAAAGEGTNSTGGYLVPAEMANTIIDLREEFGTARRFCSVVPMMSDTKDVPKRDSGLTAYFVAENAAATESQKGWSNVNLTAKKAAVLTRYSTELDEDAIINMADDLSREIAYAFAVLEDACLWNGDGSPTYGGIYGLRPKIIATTLASAVNATTNHNTLAEVDATDLMNLMAAVPKYALRNSKFYCSQVGWSTVFARIAQAGGGNTIDTIAGPGNYRYQGYPIEIDQTLPGTSGSTDWINTATIFFGDLSQSTLFGNRRNITLMASGHRYMEYDQIGILGTERFDIISPNLGTSTVAGPIAALIMK